MEYEYWVRELTDGGLECFMPILAQPDGSGYAVIHGVNYVTTLDQLLTMNPGIRAVLDYEDGEPVYISDQHKRDMDAMAGE